MSFVISNVLLMSYEQYTHPRLGYWDELVVIKCSCGVNMACLGHANAQSDFQGVPQRAPFLFSMDSHHITSVILIRAWQNTIPHQDTLCHAGE